MASSSFIKSSIWFGSRPGRSPESRKQQQDNKDPSTARPPPSASSQSPGSRRFASAIKAKLVPKSFSSSSIASSSLSTSTTSSTIASTNGLSRRALSPGYSSLSSSESSSSSSSNPTVASSRSSSSHGPSRAPSPVLAPSTAGGIIRPGLVGTGGGDRTGGATASGTAAPGVGTATATTKNTAGGYSSGGPGSQVPMAATTATTLSPSTSSTPSSLVSPNPPQIFVQSPPQSQLPAPELAADPTVTKNAAAVNPHSSQPINELPQKLLPDPFTFGSHLSPSQTLPIVFGSNNPFNSFQHLPASSFSSPSSHPPITPQQSPPWFPPVASLHQPVNQHNVLHGNEPDNHKALALPEKPTETSCSNSIAPHVNFNFSASSFASSASRTATDSSSSSNVANPCSVSPFTQIPPSSSSPPPNAASASTPTATTTATASTAPSLVRNESEISTCSSIGTLPANVPATASQPTLHSDLSSAPASPTTPSHLAPIGSPLQTTVTNSSYQNQIYPSLSHVSISGSSDSPRRASASASRRRLLSFSLLRSSWNRTADSLAESPGAGLINGMFGGGSGGNSANGSTTSLNGGFLGSGSFGSHHNNVNNIQLFGYPNEIDFYNYTPDSCCYAHNTHSTSFAPPAPGSSAALDQSYHSQHLHSHPNNDSDIFAPNQIPVDLNPPFASTYDLSLACAVPATISERPLATRSLTHDPAAPTTTETYSDPEKPPIQPHQDHSYHPAFTGLPSQQSSQQPIPVDLNWPVYHPNELLLQRFINKNSVMRVSEIRVYQLRQQTRNKAQHSAAATSSTNNLYTQPENSTSSTASFSAARRTTSNNYNLTTTTSHGYNPFHRRPSAISVASSISSLFLPLDEEQDDYDSDTYLIDQPALLREHSQAYLTRGATKGTVYVTSERLFFIPRTPRKDSLVHGCSSQLEYSVSIADLDTMKVVQSTRGQWFFVAYKHLYVCTLPFKSKHRAWSFLKLLANIRFEQMVRRRLPPRYSVPDPCPAACRSAQGPVALCAHCAGVDLADWHAADSHLPAYDESEYAVGRYLVDLGLLPDPAVFDRSESSIDPAALLARACAPPHLDFATGQQAENPLDYVLVPQHQPPASTVAAANAAVAAAAAAANPTNPANATLASTTANATSTATPPLTPLTPTTTTSPQLMPVNTAATTNTLPLSLTRTLSNSSGIFPSIGLESSTIVAVPLTAPQLSSPLSRSTSVDFPPLSPVRSPINSSSGAGWPLMTRARTSSNYAHQTRVNRPPTRARHAHSHSFPRF